MTTAVLALAAAITVPTFAQSQSSSSGQSLDQVKQARKSQMQSEGSHQIQVAERAIYGLPEVAKDRMFMAMRHIVEEPAKAKVDMMVLADVIELQSAAAQSGGQSGTSSQMGSSSVSGSSQSQSQAAEQVRDAAMRIEFKQLVTKQELQQSLAQAAIALAQTQYQLAQQGLQQQDANRTAYPLMYAGEFLGIAHTLSDKKPSDQVSKAIYDAQTLGHQLVALSQPTTGQQSSQASGQASKQSIDDLAQAAAGQMSGTGAGAGQTAAGQTGAQSGQGNTKMSSEAQRIVQEFGQALQQAQSTIKSGQSDQSSGSSGT
jgi:hypothetical protein